PLAEMGSGRVLLAEQIEVAMLESQHGGPAGGLKKLDGLFDRRRGLGMAFGHQRDLGILFGVIAI
ncbi:MAG: hypothetical protein WB462_13270, partial [Solirubrobacterales bacterium]